MLNRIIFAAALACAPIAAAQPYNNPPEVIDGRALVGPPPEPLSAAQAADTLAMRPAVSADRLAQARADQTVDMWLAFRPVLGENFSEANFPRTARVIATARIAVGSSIGATKNEWMRPRPLIVDERVIQCDTPDAELRAQGSYISGHAALGYTWALILAELAPKHASDILVRGRDYGDSRVICGMHYPSDIEAGRLIASGVVARLHGDREFRRQIDAARREMARAYP